MSYGPPQYVSMQHSGTEGLRFGFPRAEFFYGPTPPTVYVGNFSFMAHCVADGFGNFTSLLADGFRPQDAGQV